MKNRTLYPVMLLVAAAVGIGIGMLISKPKIANSQKQLDQIAAQMQTSKAESEETIQRASAEIARKEDELRRAKAMLVQMDAQLKKASAELQEIKTGDISPDTTQPIVIQTPTGTAAAAAATDTVDYVIKEGDSLWKVAEQKLGNGLRYAEILKLNPDISENAPLAVGRKIKIPAK